MQSPTPSALCPLLLGVLAALGCRGPTPSEARFDAFEDIKTTIRDSAETELKARRKIVTVEDVERNLDRWIDEIQTFYVELEELNADPEAERASFDALIGNHLVRRAVLRDRSLDAVDRLKVDLDAKTWRKVARALDSALNAATAEAATDLFQRDARERIGTIVAVPTRRLAALETIDRASAVVTAYSARLQAGLEALGEELFDQAKTTAAIRRDVFASMDEERRRSLTELVDLRFELRSHLIRSEWLRLFGGEEEGGAEPEG